VKALLLATIIAALKAYIGGGLLQRIAILVDSLTERDDMTGAEKMSAVLNAASAEAREVSSYLIRAVVEILLLKLKGA
jgi:hypothetical protein